MLAVAGSAGANQKASATEGNRYQDKQDSSRHNDVLRWDDDR
jgi:hypothetical protein